MPRIFEAEQTLPYPVAQVFAFFANPENLPRLMPKWQAARIEQATFVPPAAPPRGLPVYPASIVAGSGTRLTMTFRAVPFLPLRLPWDALIEDFRWNEGFCDVQERGPFASWRHCHTIVPASFNDPATTIRDHVEYTLPLDAIAGLADKLFVRPQLASTFRYRHQRTADLLALMNR